MEDTGYTLDQVHVLRQTFRPNEPFQAALAELTTKGPSGSRSFPIYGSDERVVEVSDVVSRDLNIQKRDADKYMETQRNVHLQLEGEISARILKANSRGAVALQLVMKPADIIAYSHIRDGLDIIQVGRRSRAVGFEATRLYATIPFEQLRPIPEVKESLAKINEALQDDTLNRLYQITPLPHLVGRFVPRESSRPVSVAYPESRVS